MIMDNRNIGPYTMSFSKDNAGYHIRVYRNGKLDEFLSDDLIAKDIAQMYWDNLCSRMQAELATK